MSETILPVSASVDDSAQSVIDNALQLHPGAPFLRPRHVAHFLGISDNGFTRYCRRCHRLKNWRGSYTFFTDDPEHMELLRHVIKLVIWSGTKLPAHLRHR